MLRRLVFALLGTAIALIVAYVVSFESWEIPTEDPALASSVEPTLHGGDVVLLLRSGAVERGHLVRCVDPTDPRAFVVGRVLGMAGDKIEIAGDEIAVNEEPAVVVGACERPTRTVRDPVGGELQVVDCESEILRGQAHLVIPGSRVVAPVSTAVEAGKLWILSDDRRFHLDSRDFGAVERATCNRLFALLSGHAHDGEPARGLSFIP